MAAPPTFVQQAETAYGSQTSPKTTPAFDVLTGDVLVAFSTTTDAPAQVEISNSGDPYGWTQLAPVYATGRTWLSLWFAPVEADRTGVTVTFTVSAGYWFGGNAMTWRACGGMGVYAKADSVSGVPTLDIATRYDNSAVVVVVSDWDAVDGASRAWRTGAGALTELTYFAGGTNRYTIYAGYHADVGEDGSKTVGLTTPVQQYSIVALEIMSADERPETLVLTKAR